MISKISNNQYKSLIEKQNIKVQPTFETIFNEKKQEHDNKQTDKWNYNMDECPLDTPVKLLSANDFPILPQQEYVGTITFNGSFKTRGECYIGDPEYFYRSAIIAWKNLN